MLRNRIEANRFDSEFLFKKRKKRIFVFFNESKKRKGSIVNYRRFAIPTEWNLAEWLKRLAVNGKDALVLGNIPASFDTVESEWQQMKQCWITQEKNPIHYSGFRGLKNAFQEGPIC
jgi:hypothetical protein